jgi:hypothetical protein
MNNATARRHSTPVPGTPDTMGGRPHLSVLPREKPNRLSMADMPDEELFELYQGGEEAPSA